MSRNNRPLLRALAACALAALCLPLTGSVLLDAQSMSRPQAAYETAVATRGSFVKTASAGAALYWPVVADVRCEVREARLDSIAITRATALTEGELLGSIRSEGSRAALSAARLALGRLRDGYASGLAGREEALADAGLALAALDGQALAAARLRLERQRLEAERYRLEQERAIAAQEEAVREIEEGLRGADLFAPVTGEIEAFSYVSVGDSLAYGQRLLSIRRADTFLLRVEDGLDRFRYGMAVTVEYGPRNARKACAGRVVSSDTVRRYNDATGYAWIRLEEDVSAGELTQPLVSAEFLRVDGVLLIPRKASRLAAGKQMVTLLQGASIANRFIRVAMNNSDVNWVLQGLEEGQVLVLD